MEGNEKLFNSLEVCTLFRDDKPTQAKAQAAPGIPYPNPGMNPGYQPMPGNQPGYYPGMPYPGMELARGYFPIQQWGGPLFDLAKAIQVGTLFPELYRPYH